MHYLRPSLAIFLVLSLLLLLIAFNQTTIAIFTVMIAVPILVIAQAWLVLKDDSEHHSPWHDPIKIPD